MRMFANLRSSGITGFLAILVGLVIFFQPVNIFGGNPFSFGASSLKDENKILSYSDLLPVPGDILETKYWGDRVTGGWHLIYLRFGDKNSLDRYIQNSRLFSKIKPLDFDSKSYTENGWTYDKEPQELAWWAVVSQLKNAKVYSSVTFKEGSQIRCDLMTDQKNRIFIQIGVD